MTTRPLTAAKMCKISNSFIVSRSDWSRSVTVRIKINVQNKFSDGPVQAANVIGEIRGKGLMIGMELVTDAASKTPAKEFCDAIITRAYHNGLILLSCGQSTVRFMPPLMIRESDVDEAVHLLDHSIAEELSTMHPHAARGAATG